MAYGEGLIGRLTDPQTGDAAYSGGKGANLAAMARTGLPVPPGFVVSTAAYRRYVDEAAIASVITQVTSSDLGSSIADLDRASARLRRAFEEAELPAWLREALTVAYGELGQGPVVVRSSATAEDLPGASFAGQLESVLNVAGVADLCDAVRRCWSSLWTARAMAYRRQHGIANANMAVAVVVQRMIPADVAGVLFTADPVTGHRDHLVIEAAPGIGEAVVSGHVTPDRWVIDAATRSTIAGPHDPPTRLDCGVAGGPLLAPGLLDTLVDLGLRAARLFGGPQDVEWAVADGRCWLLQSRPITSLFPLPPPSPEAGLRVYMPIILIGQGIAEPLTPAGTAFFRALAGSWIRYWSTGSRRREVEASPPWLPLLAGRLYCDFTSLLQRPRLAAKIVSSLAMKDPTASAALRQWLERNAGRLPSPSGPGLARMLAGWLPPLLAGLVAALVAPAKTRRHMLARTEERLAQLNQQALALSTPQQQLQFVERILPAQTLDLVMIQVPAVYGELLARITAEWLVTRWLGTTADLEPLRRWLPHDPTLAMGAELTHLARHYAATGTEPSPESSQLQEFLASYGHRAPDREIDLGLPRLTDDPTYIVELVDGYLHADMPDRGGARFQVGAAQAATAADRLVAAVRHTRGSLPALVLRTTLDRYRELAGLRERPKFDMIRVFALARRVLRRIGTTLAAEGLLDDADDVFYLDTADVHAALARAPVDLRELAATNRRTYQRELRRRAIPRIVVSDGETIYGPATPPEGPDSLTGTPVSPGVYEGTVRVLDSPVGAELRPGEILVAASTDPGWTPLFLLAGALVMEVGGVISHGAVVAREYGIPAVAAVAEATTRLNTGQRVRVDGENGTITLLDTASTLVAASTT